MNTLTINIAYCIGLIFCREDGLEGVLEPCCIVLVPRVISETLCKIEVNDGVPLRYIFKL